jgi:hypothetical protein
MVTNPLYNATRYNQFFWPDQVNIQQCIPPGRVLYYLSVPHNNDKCMSDNRRGLDLWLDLLAAYTLTTRDYNLQITGKHD